MIPAWDDEEKVRFCKADIKAETEDGELDTDFYIDLITSDLVEAWTCDALIESLMKDMDEKLKVEEIFKKYVKV